MLAQPQTAQWAGGAADPQDPLGSEVPPKGRTYQLSGPFLKNTVARAPPTPTPTERPGLAQPSVPADPKRPLT